MFDSSERHITGYPTLQRWSKNWKSTKIYEPYLDPFQKYVIAMVTFVPPFWMGPWYLALYGKLTFMAKELTEVDMLESTLGIRYPEIV